MKRLVILVILLAAAFAAGLIFFRPAEEPGWLGWVEGETLYIGGSSTSRLTALNVAEGDDVQAGALLFTFEADSEKAAVDTAKANLGKAKAALSLARSAQDRPEELEALEASRAEAEAALDYADKQLVRARALFKQQSGTKQNLDNAVSSYEQARAALTKINAQIALGKLPQREQQIEEAEQAVTAAASDLAAAEAVVALKSVTAPATGSVEETYYRTGEVVPAGRPVISLLPPENVRIEFFIPETERSGLNVNDEVTFTCDGCPSRKARISFIAKDAEYTPPEIFSREERAKLVYRSKAIPEDPAELPVGLPVNVIPENKP